MKHGRKIIYSVSLVAFVLTNMIACSKGSSGSSNTSGNVSISGNTITSSDTVNGQTLAVSLSGLTMSSNYNTGGYNYGNSSSGYASAMVTVNGSTANLSIPIEPLGSNQAASGVTVGGYYSVYYIAQCMDSACQNLGVVLWVTQGNLSYTTQVKQIGMVETVSGGTINQASESVGYINGASMSPILPTGAQLLSTL